MDKLVLAPMDGVTDLAFRLLCKKYGASLVFTEMVNAKAIVRKNKATLDKMYFVDKERPIGVQIFGSNTDTIKKAVEIVSEKQPEFIDLNLGCPVHNVVKQGSGSALLKRPEKIKEIISSMVNSTDIPITAKMRIGIKNGEGAVKIAKIIQDAGASMITVHPRTAAQGYSGKADWSYIKKIKDELTIPVIGSGDIKTKQDCKEMLKIADYAMIGRAAMTNPLIFDEKSENVFESYMKICEKYRYPKFKYVKRHAIDFTRGIKNSKTIREKLVKAKSIDEIKDIMVS